MRAVVQRVSRAKVTVEERVTGEIGPGLMILLGVGKDDTPQVAAAMAEKVANLRIFEDEQGKMNRSLLEVKSTFACATSSSSVNPSPVRTGRSLRRARRQGGSPRSSAGPSRRDANRSWRAACS